jgi:hypothetical protein
MQPADYRRIAPYLSAFDDRLGERRQVPVDHGPGDGARILHHIRLSRKDSPVYLPGDPRIRGTPGQSTSTIRVAPNGSSTT